MQCFRAIKTKLIGVAALAYQSAILNGVFSKDRLPLMLNVQHFFSCRCDKKFTKIRSEYQESRERGQGRKHR